MRVAASLAQGAPPITTPTTVRSGGDTPAPKEDAPPAIVTEQGVRAEATTEFSATPPAFAELTRAVEALQQKLQSAAPNLQFSIDKESGQTVIKVIDSVSHEVIRQIPPEEILRLDRTLTRMQEVLLKDQA